MLMFGVVVIVPEEVTSLFMLIAASVVAASVNAATVSAITISLAVFVDATLNPLVAHKKENVILRLNKHYCMWATRVHPYITNATNQPILDLC
jgi:hypothetical protein